MRHVVSPSTRYYVHGDARDGVTDEYYCASCDLFVPCEHFSRQPHGDNKYRRFWQSLDAWRALKKRRKLRLFRPEDPENILAAEALRDRHLTKANTSRFFRWLKRQSERDDPIGDLAGDAKADSKFPTSLNSLDQLRGYLIHRRACAEAIVALEEAWNEFKGQGRRRNGLTLAVRFSVFRRDEYRCQICGISAQDGSRLEVDHKVPVVKGGTDDLSNLWTLCLECNRGKGTKDL